MDPATVGPVPAVAADTGGRPLMTHRQVLEALSGLMLAMLVAILSSTVVSTSLPRIIADLGGSQASYTWVVTATLLAMTVTIPIWGKLADLMQRKLLVQGALVIFTTGSILAGLSESTSWLIGCRVVQGIGVGGLTALVQVVMSDLVSPRERGRYMGYLGAVMAVGTIGGPLLGGVLTDTVGWRWNFYVGVPVAFAALLVLQRTLKLPPMPRRRVNFDIAGATTLSSGVSLLLVWVSLAGSSYAWLSWQTAVMLPAALLLCALTVRIVSRAEEPLVPLWLFKDRVVVLAVLGTIGVGIAMFGTSLFLSQYMQLARGETPTVSGLLTLPMVVGVMVSSTVIGQVVARTGRYKRWMLAGAVMLTLGMVLMGTVDETTSMVDLGIFMAMLGIGVGMMMQNLVLVVQNSVAPSVVGAATGLVSFSRSLGGTIGVAALGAILTAQVATLIGSGMADHGIAASAAGDGALPKIDELTPVMRDIVEHAYGVGIGHVFMIAAPFGILAFVSILFMKEKPLGTRSGIEQAAGTTTEAEAQPATGSMQTLPRPKTA